MTKRRQRQVADLLHREISQLLERHVNDPRLLGITVTGVEVTPDLRSARSYVTSLGTAEEQESMLSALSGAAGFLRREIGERVELRHVPEISFHLDNSWQQGARIDALLNEIRQGEVQESGASIPSLTLSDDGTEHG